MMAIKLKVIETDIASILVLCSELMYYIVEKIFFPILHASGVESRSSCERCPFIPPRFTAAT